MKAKIKATGKIIDVYVHGEDTNGNPILYTDGKYNFYKPEDLDFNVDEKKDRLISLDKACEWLEINTKRYWMCYAEDFIEEFKQAMVK